MRIEKFLHENVLPDGTFSDKKGAVVTEGNFRMSEEDGGCDLDTCNCSEGHWIMVALPRTDDGIVEGIKVLFDNKTEMQLHLSQYTI